MKIWPVDDLDELKMKSRATIVRAAGRNKWKWVRCDIFEIWVFEFLNEVIKMGTKHDLFLKNPNQTEP